MTELGADIEEIIRSHAVRSAYQPLVDLTTGVVAGYEALARGPAGGVYELPGALFGEARRLGMEMELEWECQRAALEGALEGGLREGVALFMNIEPGLLGSQRPGEVEDLLEDVICRFPLFLELTERDFTDRPRELLAAVVGMRERGVGIVLDDVGADPRSLALMPFLAPDVVKLDLKLVQDKPSAKVAEIVHGVNAEAERTGAVVLAEGIETESHRLAALSLGARYGQGWLFGHPGPLPPSAATEVQADETLIPRGGDAAARESPFEIVTARRAPRRGDKRLLLALSLQLEAHALSLGETAVVLGAFQDTRFFTAQTGRRYSGLSDAVALVGALGFGLAESPASGVRSATLEADDPLRGEWGVAVIAPHFACGLVARDLGDDCPDMERRFDFALTYDRHLAIAAAQPMLNRLVAV